MNVLCSTALLCLVFSVQLCAQQTSRISVHYPSKETELGAEQRQQLKAWLKTQGETAKFSVKAHADSRGSDKANLELSEMRARAVKQIIVNEGFAPDSILLAFFGESQPVASNQTETGRKENRRVEITAFIPAADSSSIHDLYALLDPGYQLFTIDNRSDTIIKAAKGTIIKISANSFARTDNCLQSLTLRVKEVYDLNDILREGLSTSNNGKMLETRGMLYVDALCNGKSVDLKPGKGIVNIVPVENAPLNLGLFNGEFDPQDSIINWMASDAPFIPFSRSGFGRCCTSGSGDDCPLFFCKILRLFNRDNPNSAMLMQSDSGCSLYQQLFARLNIDTEEQLKIAMLNYGVKTPQELLNKLDEEAIAQGTAEAEDISNYIFRQTELGWINCDFFPQFEEKKLITLSTDQRADKHTRAFLIFKEYNSVMPYEVAPSGVCSFNNVPHKEAASLLVLKYKNGQPYIALEDIIVKPRITDLSFEKVSLEELKQKLALIEPPKNT